MNHSELLGWVPSSPHSSKKAKKVGAMSDKPKENQKKEPVPEFETVVKKMLETPPKPHKSKSDSQASKNQQK